DQAPDPILIQSEVDAVRPGRVPRQKEGNCPRRGVELTIEAGELGVHRTLAPGLYILEQCADADLIQGQCPSPVRAVSSAMACGGRGTKCAGRFTMLNFAIGPRPRQFAY